MAKSTALRTVGYQKRTYPRPALSPAERLWEDLKYRIDVQKAQVRSSLTVLREHVVDIVAFFTLAFPAFVELHQDAIRVAEEDRTDVSLGVAKRIGWPTGLCPMGEQALRHFFNVRDGKRHMADADLIQHDRRAAHRITWVLSQHQEGHRLCIAIAQVDNASPRVAVVIEMRQAASTGVLHLVLGHLKAQAIAIKL